MEFNHTEDGDAHSTSHLINNLTLLYLESSRMEMKMVVVGYGFWQYMCLETSGEDNSSFAALSLVFFT